jgi:hypothetical protein
MKTSELLRRLLNPSRWMFSGGRSDSRSTREQPPLIAPHRNRYPGVIASAILALTLVGCGQGCGPASSGSSQIPAEAPTHSDQIEAKHAQPVTHNQPAAASGHGAHH